MDRFFKASCTFPRADRDRSSNISQRYAFAVIFLYKCKHCLDPVLVRRFGRHFLRLQGTDLIDQQKPDFGKNIPCLKLAVLLMLDEGSLFEQGKDSLLRGIAIPEFNQVKTLVLYYRSYILVSNMLLKCPLKKIG